MSEISATQWQELSPILDELLEVEDAARAQRLAQIRRANEALANHLEALLRQRTAVERDAFLEGDPGFTLAHEPSLAGQTIGAYTLREPIGQGGMGSVWRAERSDGRYQASVAVKFLNLALLGRGGVERFSREGNMLARLSHPNIARLLDAGVAAGSQPYLVLEYIDGVPIDVWCDQRSLGIEARLRLFLEVLAAVAHAHSNLILHRDLKPSNILITPNGEVRLLDFGIGKLIEDQTGAASPTELTQLAGRAFTPDFAAPEQITQGDVTTATDVYALGVLLYLLLTGRHPTAQPAATQVDRLRAVVEAEPTRPSDATTRVKDTDLAVIATARATTPHKLARALRGDLDNILAKALKKSPAERYQTAAAFADDIERKLSGRPVTACPDSAGYRVSKFVRRHRLAVGAVSLTLLALVGGAAGTTWQAVSAARERDRAIALLMRNEALIAFVNVMLTEAAQSNRPITVRELLERSRALIAGSGSGNADIDVAVLTMLANFFLTFGEPVTAESLLANARARLLPASDPALRANVLCGHAYAAALQGRQDEARASFAQALPLARAQPTAEIECLRFRAYVARDNNDAKATLSDTQQALALLRDSGRATPLAEADLLGDLAYSHYLFGNAADADRTYALAVDRFRAAGRGDGPSVVILLNNWGIASFAAGDVQRAFASYDDALSIATRLTAEGELPVYLLANRGLANLTLARYDAAIADFRRAHAQAVTTGNSASIASSLAGMAAAHREKGDPVRAAAFLAEARGLIGKSVPAGSVPTITIKHAEARIALLDGRSGDARAAYDEIIEFFDARNMRVGPVVTALRGRAETHLHDGVLDRAATDLDRALKMAHALQGDKSYSSHVGLSLVVLHRLQLARGDVDNARRTATEAVVHLTGALGEDHPETRRARLALDR